MSSFLTLCSAYVTYLLCSAYVTYSTISLRDIPGLTANHFEITWVRDDWEPEIVEIFSDDEGLDEENENRWQKIWVPNWEE